MQTLSAFFLAFVGFSELVLCQSSFPERINSQGLKKPHIEESACLRSYENTAVMIVDMQVGFGLKPRKDEDFDPWLNKLLSEQENLIKIAIRKGAPIVVVKYECEDRCGPLVPRIEKAIKGYKNLTIVRKSTDGLFDKGNIFKSEILNFIKLNRIGMIAVAGVNGTGCVGKTILGAMKNNCSVLAIKPAIADISFGLGIHYKGLGDEFTSNDNKGGITCPDCWLKYIDNLENLVSSLTPQVSIQKKGPQSPKVSIGN